MQLNRESNGEILESEKIENCHIKEKCNDGLQYIVSLAREAKVRKVGKRTEVRETIRIANDGHLRMIVLC